MERKEKKKTFKERRRERKIQQGEIYDKIQNLRVANNNMI